MDSVGLLNFQMHIDEGVALPEEWSRLFSSVAEEAVAVAVERTWEPRRHCSSCAARGEGAVDVQVEVSQKTCGLGYLVYRKISFLLAAGAGACCRGPFSLGVEEEVVEELRTCCFSVYPTALRMLQGFYFEV